MRVTNLKITNMRAIEAAEFRFRSGFNLIVGINGVGKTTVMDALCVCLSEIVKHSNELRHSESFFKDDIRVEGGALSVECKFDIVNANYQYFNHMPRNLNVARKSRIGMPRESVYRTPINKGFIGPSPPVWAGTTMGRRPLAIFFSTKRAVPSDRRMPTKGRASGGLAAAFAEALSSRELRLSEFADWMRVQMALRSERSEANRILIAFEKAVQRFLPGFSHLRLGREGSGLMIDRGETPLDVRQLSDGERGTLALVLDLTRRLAQANPEMHDPAGSAEAVVLIDEIDLHLHPTRQRQIVENLMAVFPKCQFIATTHSPQVVGQVFSGHVLLIREDGVVEYPAQTFGMDSNWILREIMEADDRDPAIRKNIDAILTAIRDGKLGTARKLLGNLRQSTGETPDVAAATAKIARAQELLTEHTEKSVKRKKANRGHK